MSEARSVVRMSKGGLLVGGLSVYHCGTLLDPADKDFESTSDSYAVAMAEILEVQARSRMGALPVEMTARTLLMMHKSINLIIKHGLLPKLTEGWHASEEEIIDYVNKAARELALIARTIVFLLNSEYEGMQ